MQLSVIQPYIPARVKFALKPFYRVIFPNKLHLLLYPTFRCNYKCSYCHVVTKFDYSSVVGYKAERSAADWIEALDRMPPAVIYIAGGEPFLYRGLADLINGMPTKHEVIGVVTNLSVNVDVYRRVKRKMHLNASFHREFATQEQFIEKIHRLADHFHIHVNIVATPENLPVLAEVSRQFTAEKISLHVDPYVDQSYSYSQEQRELLKKHIQSDRDPSKQLDYSNGIKKKCSAGRNYVNIGPDGSAFTCSGGMGYVYSPLYASLVNGESTDAFRMGNIFSPDFRLNTEDMMCTLPCKEACDRDAAIIKIV